MGVSYTQPTLSGFNSSPPPDDGTVSVANLIKWQDLIDELFTPFDTYVDAINSAVDAAFDDAVSLSQNNALTSGTWAWGQDISPTQITANQDDYNPTSLSTAVVLRLTSDASRNITGIQGGADGRILILHNVGSNNIVLIDDATSTAANRFQLAGDYTLAPDTSIILQYDSTSSRWRMIGGLSAATSAQMEAATASSVVATPANLIRHPGVAKAGGSINPAAGTPALLGSHGTTSIADTATGRITVTVSNTFSAIASMFITGGGRTNNDGDDYCAIGVAKTTTTFEIQTFDATGAANDFTGGTDKTLDYCVDGDLA